MWILCMCSRLVDDSGCIDNATTNQTWVDRSGGHFPVLWWTNRAGIFYRYLVSTLTFGTKWNEQSFHCKPLPWAMSSEQSACLLWVFVSASSKYVGVLPRRGIHMIHNKIQESMIHDDPCIRMAQSQWWWPLVELWQRNCHGRWLCSICDVRHRRCSIDCLGFVEPRSRHYSGLWLNSYSGSKWIDSWIAHNWFFGSWWYGWIMMDSSFRLTPSRAAAAPASCCASQTPKASRTAKLPDCEGGKCMMCRPEESEVVKKHDSDMKCFWVAALKVPVLPWRGKSCFWSWHVLINEYGSRSVEQKWCQNKEEI